MWKTGPEMTRRVWVGLSDYRCCIAEGGAGQRVLDTPFPHVTFPLHKRLEYGRDNDSYGSAQRERGKEEES